MLQQKPGTHYQALGCSRTASQAELKAAFQAAALRLHPDKQAASSEGGAAAAAAAQQQYQWVQEAWQVLRDPQRRAAYDHQLTQQALRDTVTLQDEIAVDEMEVTEMEGEQAFVYSCRCGDVYVLPAADWQLAQQAQVVPCRTCSNHILVTKQ